MLNHGHEQLQVAHELGAVMVAPLLVKDPQKQQVGQKENMPVDCRVDAPVTLQSKGKVADVREGTPVTERLGSCATKGKLSEAKPEDSWKSYVTTVSLGKYTPKEDALQES
jgi:hypothetical protein